VKIVLLLSIYAKSIQKNEKQFSKENVGKCEKNKINQESALLFHIN
jgi:hypothetical protein